MSLINFTLPYLDKNFTLDICGGLTGENPLSFTDVSAVAIYNMKLSDMRNVFKFQADSFDVNDLSSSDIKYYVFMNAWPNDASLNPAHASMTTGGTPGLILPVDSNILANKNLVKHDFVRFLAKHLFNTPFGVDLFNNEEGLLADLSAKGRIAKDAIMSALNTVSTTSAAVLAVGQTDGSGNYATNLQDTNSNICRELMRQIAARAPARFNGIFDISGVQSVPLVDGDTISFRVTIRAHPNQHNLTGVASFDARVYKIQLNIKASGYANVTPVDVGGTDMLDYVANA
jgi:hypothetical protein